MKITTYSDVRDLLRAYIPSTALGAALELGLFWKLADQPQTEDVIARNLGIPLKRCRYWLEILSQIGLLEKQGELYTLSAEGRTAIVDARSQETWALLAQGERENYLVGNDLTVHIQKSDSTWALQGLAFPDYVQQMRESPDRARRFTRMLYELHQPLANELAETIDMTGVHRLMDVGGGSGVISLALLRRYPNLTATVFDIPNVCAAGQEIAAENEMAGRIVYRAADILHDPLPTGFDMVLVCDTWFHDEAILTKLSASLNAGGPLVIAGEIVTDEIARGLGHAVYDFKRAMYDPGWARFTQDQVCENLHRASLTVERAKVLADGLLFIQARKG